MIKSPRTLLRFAPLVVASALALSACGSSSAVTSANDVFTVNGKGYSKTDFNAITQALVDAEQFKAVNGKVTKEDADTVLKTILRYEVFVAFASQNDLEVTEADRNTIVEQAAADKTFTALPQILQDLVINLNVASAKLQTVPAATAARAKALYEKSPASSGVLCLSHVLVKTEAQAKAVLADLDKGAKFADVAAKKSIEPGAKESGGSLGSGDSDCSQLAELQTSFDKDFLAGAVAAKMGVPTGPVKSSFGYHIILNRNYDEVKDSVLETLNKATGNNLLAGYMTSAKISVNSVYGVWNSAIAATN